MTPARRIARLTTVVLCTVPLFSACVSWHVSSATPAAVVAEQPSRLLVESHSGEVVELANPQIVGDSLVGSIPGTGTPGTPLDRAAFALPDISRVATRRLDMRKTMGAFIAPGAFALLGIQVMSY